MSTPERVAVVGAGLMGHGIAQVFAAHGHPVTVIDQDGSLLATVKLRIADNLTRMAPYGLADAGGIGGILDRITVTADLAEACAGCDVAIEAVSEDLALKQQLFRELDQLCPPDVILCSNTSVISITAIAAVTRNRGRILGTHWWNPPYLIPLVEIVRTEETADWCIDRIEGTLRQAGKLPVRVQKDVPGFVGNRLQHALWREAFALIDAGVCDAATIDEVVRQGFGLRLPVLGPVENADMVGLDLTLAIHRYLLPYLDNSSEPSSTLQAQVAEGRLGFKTAAGFLPRPEPEAAASRARLTTYLLEVLAGPRSSDGVNDQGEKGACA